MKKQTTTEQHIARLSIARVRFNILGRTPLLMHRQSQKVIFELTLPSAKKNKAERASIAKHDPVLEFRNTIYMNRDANAPTACHMPSGAFKGAITNAALRIPGGNKTETGQLISIASETVHIYGIPLLHAASVRQAGISKTPDIRFRAVFPAWCCVLEINYVPPLLNDEIVFNLLAGAGLVMGVGDGRPEKGRLSHGQFAPVADDDPEFRRIVKAGGRVAQLAAIRAATPYDDEARQLLDWYCEEAKRRRFTFTAPGSKIGAA